MNQYMNDELKLQSEIILNGVKLFIIQCMKNEELKNSQTFLDFLDELNKLSIQW